MSADPVERLKQAVNAAIPTSDLEWPGDDIVSTRILAAIVEECWITEEKIERLRLSDEEPLQYLADDLDILFRASRMGAHT